MTDYIGGRVRRVIDISTFEMDITYKGKDNVDQYGYIETIKLASYPSSSLDREGRKLDSSELKNKILNRFVTLRVIGRDEDDRVIAYISH